MKKTIYNKFDKATINALPLVEYPYKINVILNEYEAERAVDYLLTSLVSTRRRNLPSAVDRTIRWRCCRWPHANNVSFSASIIWDSLSR